MMRSFSIVIVLSLLSGLLSGCVINRSGGHRDRGYHGHHGWHDGYRHDRY